MDAVRLMGQTVKATAAATKPAAESAKTTAPAAKQGEQDDQTQKIITKQAVSVVVAPVDCRIISRGQTFVVAHFLTLLLNKM
jgi:hypothetical protein